MACTESHTSDFEPQMAVSFANERKSTPKDPIWPDSGLMFFVLLENGSAIRGSKSEGWDSACCESRLPWILFYYCNLNFEKKFWINKFKTWKSQTISIFKLARNKNSF